MARIFAPIVPPNDPRQCAPWLNRELRRISGALQQGQRGMAAVARGEAPDASGSPLVDLSGVFLLAGRFNGQIGYGGRASAENLTFGSTQHGTKGFIYLGTTASSRVAWDETNNFFGIGTDTPRRTLHLKVPTNTTTAFQRFEAGTAVTVNNCVSNGTTAVTSTAGFGSVVIGMLVFGTLVPVGTTVTGWTDTSNITLSNSVPAGTSTMTFSNQAEFTYVQDTEWRWNLSAALAIVATGGVTPSTASGLRFITATDGAPMNNTPRGWLQFGPTNLNGNITGYNAANGNSLRVLFNYISFNTWGGVGLDFTAAARVGVNIDPFDYSSSAAASQPGNLWIARTVALNTAVPTVGIEGVSGTNIAFAILTGSGGTRPSKTINTSILGGFRHDGKLALCGGGVQGLMDGSGPSVMQLTDVNGNNFIRTATQAAWSDSLAAASSLFANLGFTSGAHRAWFFASGGFSVFTRFGISSAYTLISNGQAGGASGGFPAPDNTSNPTLLYLMNSTNNGFDASVLVKFKSQRSGQTGDYAQFLNQSNDQILGSISKAGVWTGLTANVSYDDDAIYYEDENVYYSAVNP